MLKVECKECFSDSFLERSFVKTKLAITAPFTKAVLENTSNQPETKEIRNLFNFEEETN